MPVFKISYVVIGMDHPGAIANSDHKPVIGEQVKIGEVTFEVIEVFDLIPARGDFHYIHATCQPVVDSLEQQATGDSR